MSLFDLELACHLNVSAEEAYFACAFSTRFFERLLETQNLEEGLLKGQLLWLNRFSCPGAELTMAVRSSSTTTITLSPLTSD